MIDVLYPHINFSTISSVILFSAYSTLLVYQVVRVCDSLCGSTYISNKPYQNLSTFAANYLNERVIAKFSVQ